MKKKQLIYVTIVFFILIMVLLPEASALPSEELSLLTGKIVRYCLVIDCQKSPITPENIKNLLDFTLSTPTETDVTLPEDLLELFDNALLALSVPSAEESCIESPICQTPFHKARLTSSCQYNITTWCDHGCSNGECNTPPAYINCVEWYGNGYMCATLEEIAEKCPDGAIKNKRAEGCDTSGTGFGYCYQCR
jgi:hypothetical protein